MYYFLEDVYPLMSGRRVLKTPALLRALFQDQTEALQPEEEEGRTVEPGPHEPHRAGVQGFPAPGVVPPPPGFNQGKNHI